ncbi:MAG: hypothetical protein DMD64_05815 [Gemmatimonadetes bacterium]|nr:MAG: hypothetical protein DMD64_05815 [Gemmatimonadota bacterium]
MIDALLADLRYALRQLARSPGFTLGVVCTLALGIGANVTMFSVLDRMMFRAPPLLRDPGAVHRVYLARRYRGEEFANGAMQYARYDDLTNWTSSFARTAAFTEEDIAIGIGADAREMRVGIVSASFFGFFDAPPALGRYFTAAEDTPPNGTPVAVLAYTFWQTRYAGRSDVLGSTLQIGPGPRSTPSLASPRRVSSACGRRSGLWHSFPSAPMPAPGPPRGFATRAGRPHIIGRGCSCSFSASQV